MDSITAELLAGENDLTMINRRNVAPLLISQQSKLVEKNIYIYGATKQTFSMRYIIRKATWTTKDWADKGAAWVSSINKQWKL